MKLTGIILSVYLLLPVMLFSQQGSTCSNPYPLIIDGVSRTFATSATTGNAVVCSYTNGTPITYFSFTTNGSAECVLLDIEAPTTQPCEIIMYTANTCGNPTRVVSCDMCFDDGVGLWAPAESYTLSPNTTYYLRVKTTTSGNISIAAQFYDPPNNTCLGATQLGPTYIEDNNACHKPGTGVLPSQLCAFTLENTAFYKYTIASTGTSTINITNIECDNGDANNSNGFQIGFFTGTCAALIPVPPCSSNSGSSVNATTAVLPAGTNVYVGIDGVSGSNCKYQIRATNSVALSAYIKYFSAWKTSTSNILKWLTLQEFNNHYFEIERSVNGIDFYTIGRINGEVESYFDKTYQFEDKQPAEKSFYRLKSVDLDGQVKYFKTIVVIRTDLPYIHLSLQNPVSNNLLLNLQTNMRGEMNMQIVSLNGLMYVNEKIKCKKGDNQVMRNISSLPPGMYQLIITGETMKAARGFVKTNTLYYK